MLQKEITQNRNSSLGYIVCTTICRKSEATAYIVGEHFGLHNEFSSDYLQMYGNDAASLIAQLDRIRTVAHTIIEQVEKALGSTESLQDVAA